MNRTKVFYDKPIYIGFSVLDISKLLMYDFFYKFVKKQFPGNKSKLCYIDTDSLTLLIQTENIYDTMRSHIQYFDTSNFNENNEHNMPLVNKTISELFKDEYGGKILTEFIGLRSKCTLIELMTR